MGELGDLEKHIKSDDGCGYEVVRCKNFGIKKMITIEFRWSQRVECGKDCERRFLSQHGKDCEFRQMKCEFCGHMNTFDAIAGSGRIHLDRDTIGAYHGSNHYGECGQYPVECPNKCGEKDIKRGDISGHREKCPLESLDCPFKNVGCTSKMARRDIEGHCQTNMQTHLLMMMKSHDQLLKRVKELEDK